MPAPRGRMPISTGLRGLAVALFIGIVGLSVQQLADVRRLALDDSTKQMADLDMVLAEQTGRAVETIDVALRALITQSGPDLAHSVLSAEAARQQIAGIRALQAVDLVDPAGHVVLTTRSEFRDRLPQTALAQLARHAATEQTDPLISEPFREADGRWTALLTRRIDRADKPDHTQRFAGMAVAWIDLGYFEDFYKAVELRDNAAVLLHRRDGTVLARYPHSETIIGVSYANLPPFRDVLSKQIAGTLEMDSPLDDSRRIVAIRALKAFPLAVNISVDEGLVLAGWRRQAWMFAIAAVCVGSLIMALVLELARRSREVEMLLADSMVSQTRAEAANRDIRVQMDERQRAETALRNAQRLEAVGQLTGGVAHDFNNLLTVLLGNIDLMQSHPAAAVFTGRLTTMRSAAERGARLISHLLAFARRQPLLSRAVDLCQLIRGMQPLLESAIGTQVEIEMDLPADVPPALVDPTQIELVILNLAINARDSMPLGGRLTISVACTSVERSTTPDAPQPGNYVALRVADTGTGMSPEVLARAFEPYFTTKAQGAGSGLGLSQVYGMARQSGGSVRLESALGQGTMVEVLLPEAAQSDLAAEPPSELSPGSMAGAGVASLLVVDDDTDVRSTTALLLRRMGYRVAEASNAEEALMALELDPGIELLLTDVVMPQVSGPELAAKALLLRPDLPIVYFSGYADPEAIVGAIPLTRLLRKPFRPLELVTMIETALAEQKVSAASHAETESAA